MILFEKKETKTHTSYEVEWGLARRDTDGNEYLLIASCQLALLESSILRPCDQLIAPLEALDQLIE